jgi:triacylglycerol lipase
MQKPLPPQTARSLNPPANVLEPYRFFESVGDHPLQPLDRTLNLRNAWWFADVALLAYSSEAAIKTTCADAGISRHVVCFFGAHSSQAYVISMPDAILLAFRGTQVDDFWASILDFSIDARFLPVPDSHGDLVHAGFLAALEEIWSDVLAHVLAEQASRSRPLWITGHSLGAALATIAANRCADDPRLGLQGIYTFGSPRVGDPGFGGKIHAPVFRFRNDSDIVPHLPIGLLFRHLPQLQFIDGAGHLHRDVPSPLEALLDHGAQRMSIKKARSMQAALRSQVALEVPLPGFLADHAPLNYSIQLWNMYDRGLE